MEPLNVAVVSQLILEDTLKALRESLSSSMFVRPTRYLKSFRTEPIPASKLKFSEVAVADEDLEYHFESLPINHPRLGLDYTRLTKNIVKYFESRKECILKKGHFLTVLKRCDSEITTNLENFSSKTIRNEASLRFSVVNPIVSNLCWYWKLQIELEESISHSQHVILSDDLAQTPPPRKRARQEELSATPGTTTSKSISSNSICDYVVYSIKNDRDLVIGLIIEAKMEERSSHAVAQVIGYYVKLGTMAKHPPLIFVVTERSAKLIIFPFQIAKDGIDCVECVQFPTFDIWEGRGKNVHINYSWLSLIFMFFGDGTSLEMMDLSTGVPKKNLAGKIKTEKEEIEEKNKKLEEDKEKLKEKLKEKNKEFKEKSKEFKEKNKKLEEEVAELKKKLRVGK